MRFHRTLWTIQILLAGLFLFAGGVKLVLPLSQLAGPIALPGLFLRFIGVCEVLGALGLILPSALRIRPVLTPVAAAGLVLIMIGATTLSAMAMGPAAAVVPFVAGVLAACVASGRVRTAVIAPRGADAGQRSVVVARPQCAN
jgi:DoxX-like protein